MKMTNESFMNLYEVIFLSGDGKRIECIEESTFWMRTTLLEIFCKFMLYFHRYQRLRSLLFRKTKG